MRRIVLADGRWSESDEAGPCWVRAAGSQKHELDGLATELGLHPLTIEDVQNNRQRPKVEDYDGHTFVVLRVPRGDDPDDGWQQVGVWLLEDAVVTASLSPLPELDAVEKRLSVKSRPKSVLMLWYRILDALVDSWFPFMDALEEAAEQAEDRAMDKPDQENLYAIRDLKHTVSRVRKLVQPLREAMISLERNDHPHVDDSVRIYLRDISDHTIRLSERLEHVREMALIAQETWNATLANSQNQVMKRLTVVAALLLLPGLLAGLGGMNFDGFPAWDYWIVTGSIIAFVIVGASVAIWRRWL